MDNPVVFQATATDLAGNALDTAQITVTNVSTGLPAIIFSDLNESPLSNPFNTEDDGYFNFYCEGQVVNITAEKDGFSQTWQNQFLNTESVIPYLLTLNNTWTSSQSFAGGDYFAGNVLFDGTINIDNFVINGGGGFVESADGLSGSKVLQVNGIPLLNELTLSNSNNIVDQNRAVTNLGWWEIAQENLGSAAFDDKTIPSATLFDTGNLNYTIFPSYKAANIKIGTGYGLSTTQIYLDLPTNFYETIASALNVTSTFEVLLSGATSGVISAGIGAADMSLSIYRSDKITRIVLNNLTGIVENETYTIRTETNTSEIELL